MRLGMAMWTDVANTCPRNALITGKTMRVAEISGSDWAAPQGNRDVRCDRNNRNLPSESQQFSHRQTNAKPREGSWPLVTEIMFGRPEPLIN